MNDKKYFIPKIKRVELSAEQAIIQVCSVGGAYFLDKTATPDCYMRSTVGGMIECPNSNRGYRGRLQTLDTFAIPS